jgi:hypothetical protein
MTTWLAIYAAHNWVMAPDTALVANNVVATEQKIASFEALPSGWHYGEGFAPSSNIIANARDWHRKLMEAGFTTTDAFPGVGGEIMIAGYHGNHVVEIVLEIDNSISLYHELDDETVRSLPNRNSRHVSEELKKISGELWSTFDFSTNETLILGKTASTGWHLGTTEVAAPSFNMIASCKVGQLYAPIYGNTTRQWRVNRRSSGFLREIGFPPAGQLANPHPQQGTSVIITSSELPTSNTQSF